MGVANLQIPASSRFPATGNIADANTSGFVQDVRQGDDRSTNEEETNLTITFGTTGNTTTLPIRPGTPIPAATGTDLSFITNNNATPFNILINNG